MNIEAVASRNPQFAKGLPVAFEVIRPSWVVPINLISKKRSAEGQGAAVSNRRQCETHLV